MFSFFLNMIILRTELISHMLLVSTGCHIWILGFLSVRNPHIVLNFPLTRNHLTSICISRSSLLIPTATRKLLLKVSLFVTAGVVQPLNFSMLRDINSGKDSDLENVLSSSCCLSSEVLHTLIVVHYLNRSA